ncbi:flavin reductase family protein [Streptomyces agglomeratus]|uniref:flavin reductase family protein n=1 Tax=Streptomyces agglomeratus TaxID=285458 RepID=UPI000A407FBB|nr:flavin reductase family protein [Streptomyces agglomeratus]
MTATPSELRAALACFPSGVTVVTTRDDRDRPRGFTASSFCSVSLDPPLVLVCLARTADSFPVFLHCGHFAVSVLRPWHEEVARRFASKSADKFGGGWAAHTLGGLPVVPDALCTLECAVYDRHEAGDHLILIGEVGIAAAGDGEPMVYYGRAFHRLAPA